MSRTSGKVPLEKTLAAAVSIRVVVEEIRGAEGGRRDLHEQACLSTSTVTNNDQLATDFRHLRNKSTAVRQGGRLSAETDSVDVVWGGWMKGSWGGGRSRRR
jgi:hypothetical protein